MEFTTQLAQYNLNEEQLQIGLNHLGFKISSFQDIQQDQLDELVDIFIKVADFDFSISNQVTKFKIKEFKGKLEKVLKGQKIKVKKTIETIKEIDNNVIDSKKINFNQELISPDKIIKKTINLNLTLGKVKYFNPNDNFRFIQSLKYNIDFYANLSNVTTKNIEINDVVIFETVVSKKKPGELDAIKVSNNIPVFIVYLETKCYVFPLIIDFLDNEILLIEKNDFGFATGFATINANIQNQKWFAVENPNEIIPKSTEEFYAKKILAKLLQNLNKYKGAIEWLSAFLQNALNEIEFNSIYSETINNFEQKTIPEIYKEIENFMSISFFQSFFEEKKKSLNKISFVLWLQGECDKLPHPSKKEEIDIWNVEILPSLERDTLRQVLTKLLSEQGATKQVEESYNYLISQGLQINAREELEAVAVFLEAFIYAFPSIKITEANFSCNNTQFYIELYDRGILKTLSDDLIELYFNELKSDDEKNIFINILFLKQGASFQIETLYKYLISKGWQITNYKELEAIAFFLEKFIIAFPAIEIIEANFSCTTTQYYIELYNKRILKELSETRTKQYIEELKTDDEKAGFIEKLPSDKILSYYISFPSLSNYQEKYIAGILESEFSKIDFLCFDLESDGEKINEFAWKSRLGVKSESDFKKPEDGIAELVTLINSGSLIIGQNIKEFDLSVLANHGASPSSNFIWDTLEVEMLLNPERFSYGLKTQHSAASDTELTYRLFKNQLSRIIVSQSNLDAVKELLPSKAIEAINQISSNSNWALLDYEYFVKQSNEFFRPNPTNQNISEQTFNQLTEKLNEEGNKVVIAPEFLWNTLSHQFDLTFYSDNKSLRFCLKKEKIEATLWDDKLLKAILFRFVDSCISKGLQPYFQHLPIAIRLKLNSEQSTLICDNIDVDFGNINHKPICIKPTDIEILKQHGNQVSDLKVIVIGNELYNLTSKLQLGQDLDFATIFDRLKNEPIWLQMSGGKSFISLEQSHCRHLGITEFPEFVQNIWLEKIGKGKFKVWCNLNFEACINDLPFSEAYYIDWVDETFTKTNSFIIRPDARKSGYIAEQKRVNPESLYRKIYWVYQFKLFECIGNTNNPKVLIVNDELEIEKLSAYARKKGYFIPDIRASLTRQMELLHAHKSPKLIITTFSNLDRVISSNYSGSLDYIWDSFLLQEKVQMLKGKIDKKDIEITENDKFIPFLKGDSTKKEDFDTYKLFKLHKPLVDYYYKMMIDNNHKSCLYLCDTRLADFVGIEQSLEVKAKYMSLWVNEEDFQADYKGASGFFPKDKIETNFDIDDAKKILSRLFLPKKENGEFNSWYDEQDNCLNDILPAEKDLLISLPTGAGKSVLFQAPALFRASFTNKLSIVITPLKALMHDQVEILHKMGLYSNVEYLSGDKPQEEIKDIYRRIAGGEITLLYITPERFRSRSFEICLLTRMDADNGLEYVVFDEAHCISQWGQEFRPDYLNAGRVISDKSKIFPMVKLLFSATISDQVLEEVQIIFHDKTNPKKEIELVKGLEKNYNPVRDHIKMEFKHNIIDEERLNEIAAYLDPKTFNSKLSRAIIFVKSRKKVEECTLLFPDTLKDVFGIECDFQEKVGSFHAGMDAEDRKDTYEKYKSGEIVILFATKAFGMGMDIPNIHFVTHFSPPSTFEDFLQEVGRAGRNKEKLLEAGFNNRENPIKALCLTAKDDFANLKQQLDKSRISWPEIKEIKSVLEKYIARFKPLIPNTDIPVAVPFNLYSNDKKQTDIDINDTKFRIALHWLEKLGRIKLGYFTITHLEFDSASLKNLANQIDKCPDENCKKVCNAIIQLMAHIDLTNEVIQLSIASLRSNTKLSLENLFKALQKNHNAGILKLLQEIVIEPTNIRIEEINYYKNKLDTKEKYPALKVIFSFTKKIFDSVPLNDSKSFDGEYLDYVLKGSINEKITFNNLPWSKESNAEKQSKEQEKYINDIIKKRGKHAFTIIRKLGKTKHESKPDLDKANVVQIVSSGYHKKEEWNNRISTIEKDCIKLLDYIAKEYEKKNKFNWSDIISTLKIEGGIQYLSDLLFILSVLGYCKIRGGLLPSGIEVYLSSTEDIDETITESNDKIIYNEFTETQEVRELKLISLQVLANLEESDEQDAFIKGFFAAKSKKELINHLEGKIDSEHPIFKAFRGDAIKFQENHRLNDEQRAIYLSEPNQNINVMAGPGSGKTHTLTLRVAKLIYYNHANPEEILVLAYNSAVVSELKERLGKLFRELGYGNLAKRIKIFTFHGLAKKYSQEHLEGLKFEEWEPKLLELLNKTPVIIKNQLAPLKHILVDEFQDIDEVRMDLLNKLNELTNAYLFIIGDPNQSIYGYARKVMNPYHYYNDFDKLFNPQKFNLLNNHRSYPEILNIASQILTLPAEHQHLIPIPTKSPETDFIPNYAQVIDRIQHKIDWWNEIENLCLEKVKRHNDTEAKPYKQIAILFRTNNEVYRGFQKIKRLKLSNIRIRIQGSLPYEFTRIRECHTIILYLKSKAGPIPSNFKQTFYATINDLIYQNQNWNHFYMRVIHAIVLEYLDEQDENQNFDNLLEFITELTHKDDGQLYKIYEKHQNEVGDNTQETEIVLTTMHKVKGLEFDSVIIAPSFSNLPLKINDLLTQAELDEQLDEEKRLAFVAYTRARYRLLIFKRFREMALANNNRYVINENEKVSLGIPAKPGLEKLNIGWSAKEFNFNRGVNNYIKNNLKSGDEVKIVMTINGGFQFYEIVDTNNRKVGSLSQPQGNPNEDKFRIQVALRANGLTGFVINEIVQFSYDETLTSDEKNGTNYAIDWCQEARNQGYIYLVDFAGFGKIIE
jgi:RecQ family ATP-dependent DNA helicase